MPGGARGNNASSGGCPNGGRREETQTDSSQVGSGGRGSATPCKETEAGALTQLTGIIPKQCLRTEQETRSLCGAIFDTIIMATEHDVVESMREQTRRYNEGVQAAGKGHTLSPPQIWAWSGLIAALQCSDSDRLLKTARRHGHGHEVRSCEVLQGRSDVPVRASSHHSGVRDPVVSALQQLGAACKYGRAPPTQVSRELQQWLDTLLVE